MTSLVLAALFFVGIHVFVSGSRLRGVIAARTGENGFQGLFSLLSLVGLAWLGTAYARAPYVALWGQLEALKPLALVVVLVAFLFAAIGLTTPSPTAAGGEGRLDDAEPARGILRVTRHPFLWGVAIWAAAHLLVNGDLAALVLFGALLTLALIGPLLIDGKRAARFGDRWERFAAVTSNVPFAAIASGRNRLRLGELGWWRVAIALGAYALLITTHGWLFGASALPL
jgi:uncharacterized membrane protein